MVTLTFQALARTHDVAAFDCGVPALDTWLKAVAGQHQKNGTSKTFVLVDAAIPATVIGFFAMSLRAPTLVDALPPAMQKKLPQAISGYTLARLAVSVQFKGQGHGERLLLKAMQKAQLASKSVAGFGLFVDAKEGAAAFYEKYGFTPFPDDPDTLVYPIAAMPAFPDEEPEA
jgi:ribosomal protein S18 acetylase RimI-like enzyme